MHRAVWSSRALSALAALCLCGCPARTPTPDAGVDVPSADHPETGGRRRRRRARVRLRRPRPGVATPPGALAQANPAVEPEEDDVEPAPQRPRMTETGPMLPEDLGPPPERTLDLGAAGSGLPEGLEPRQVSRGLDPLLPRLSTCAGATTDDNGHGPHGHVTVRLRVRNDGRPVAARVSGGGGPPLFTVCVRRVVASARFDRFGGVDVFVTWGFDID